MNTIITTKEGKKYTELKKANYGSDLYVYMYAWLKEQWGAYLLI